jgi:hypothetical protein
MSEEPLVLYSTALRPLALPRSSTPGDVTVLHPGDELVIDPSAFCFECLMGAIGALLSAGLLALVSGGESETLH